MPTDQYHEPASEMSDELRDFARVIQSLIEEADAINWYEQRIAATDDKEVANIMHHAQKEEFEHFAIDLEWLSRRMPEWRKQLQGILFKEGDIVENAKALED